LVSFLGDGVEYNIRPVIDSKILYGLQNFIFSRIAFIVPELKNDFFEGKKKNLGE
jgi:hypothetical protein